MKIKNTAFLFFIIYAGCSQPYNKDDLYGTWVYQHNERQIVFVMTEDSTCRLIYTTGSESAMLNGNFEVNFTKKPAPLSIRNIPQLNHPLHTIIRFQDKNSFKISKFSPRWRLRPIAFDGDGDMVFKRK